MSTSRYLIRGLLAGVTLVSAVPVLAQEYYPDTSEDIVVQGRWGRVPDDADSLSQRVSYADLDLRYAEDRRELRHRVDLTARYLCDRLGEDESSSSIVPSCREAATRDALRRVGTVEAHWAPRDTGWVRPARWEAPYPDEWNDKDR